MVLWDSLFSCLILNRNTAWLRELCAFMSAGKYGPRGGVGKRGEEEKGKSRGRGKEERRGQQERGRGGKWKRKKRWEGQEEKECMFIMVF